MKKMLIALAALVAGFAWGDEELVLVEKEITQITVPFGIRAYTPSNKDVVRVEKTSDTALRITALRAGRCDLEVRGDMDMTQKFQISVGGDLPKTLATLRRELERVPEVHAEIVGDSIRVDGEVKSVRKWDYLAKVLRHYKIVRNFAEFTPGEEILLTMKETLQQSGFAVKFDPYPDQNQKAWKANTVALAYSAKTHTMTVQAKVYTPEQKAKILECLKSERWLALDRDAAKNAGAADEYKVRADLQVYVDKPVIRLSVAYMAIGESDLKKIGNPQAVANENGGLSLSGAFSSVYDLIRGQSTGRHGNNTAMIGASLGVTTRFFKQNGVSRVSDTGYTLLESWDKDGAKFKSGGTLFVKVQGVETAELKEIEYGFQLNTKGGVVNENEMSADIDFMTSTILPTGSGEYDRKEDKSKLKISFPIGRTTLIAGFKDLIDKNSPPSGLPYLRNTPMLNWFVADSGKEVSDRRLVVMVCPEIVDNTVADKPDVDKEINIRVPTQGGKDTDQVIEERKEHTGFWSWLNWFSF